MITRRSFIGALGAILAAPLKVYRGLVAKESKQPKIELTRISFGPPRSICPVCGSVDIDYKNGRGKCYNCPAEFELRMEIEVHKFPDWLC